MLSIYMKGLNSSKISFLEVLPFLVTNDLLNILFNTAVALKILQAMDATFVSKEKSFSELKTIKMYVTHWTVQFCILH